MLEYFIEDRDGTQYPGGGDVVDIAPAPDYYPGLAQLGAPTIDLSGHLKASAAKFPKCWSIFVRVHS